MVWRGAWSPVTAYTARDGVQYNGSSWIALQPSVNIPPGSSGTMWSLFALRGADGPPGGVGPAGPQGMPGANGTATSSYYAVLPAASSFYAGSLATAPTGAGAQTGLYVCLQSLAGTYSWKLVSAG